MNNLSWFLYFADVLPKIAGTAGAVAIILSFTYVAFSVFYSMWANDIWSHDDEHVKKLKLAARENPFPKFGKVATVVVVAVLLATVVPSRDTLYLIAGSELGEMVLQSQEARDMYEDIRQVIRSNIKGTVDGNPDS